jgi:ribosomal protein S18 acetylase RimI-like enzyme
MDNGNAAGVLLAELRTAGDPELGYVDVLGVRRPWRQRGIGLALLQHSFREFYRRGTHKVCLGVDTESLTGATRLYEKAGMRVARRYVDYQKELRPGVDLSTQSIEE